jgi:hypothetical protein
MRVPFDSAERGSQRWIQLAVNDHAAFLDRAIREALGFNDSETITWLSPLREDEYAEYRDNSFLERLNLKLPTHPLKEFWPRRGPQWDALGRTSSDSFLLVEAKANLPELVSPACQASEESKSLIQRSLREVQEFLGVEANIDWTGKLYQFANRIAHMYLLRELNQIPAYLVFIYFIGDKKVGGLGSVSEWKAALAVVKGVLGIGNRHRLSKYMADVYIDVAKLSATGFRDEKISLL